MRRKGTGIMKKAFWGYNVKDVDAEINELEAENFKLTQKIKGLEAERTEQLAHVRELRDELTNAHADAENFAKEAGDAECAVREELAAARDELAAARGEAERAKADVAELQKELEELREKNSIDVKGMTREKMEQLLAVYADGWKRSNDQMRALLDQIAVARERAREAFIISADEILRNFDEIGNAVGKVNGSITDYEMHQPEIMREFDQIFSLLDDDQRIPQASHEPAEAVVEENLPMILQEIKERLAVLRRAEAQRLSQDRTAEKKSSSVKKRVDKRAVSDMADMGMVK